MTEELRKKAGQYAVGMAANYMEENQALPDDQTINDFTMTFIAGYNSRQSEIDELVKTLSSLSAATESYDDQDDRCMKNYYDALSKASELLKKYEK